MSIFIILITILFPLCVVLSCVLDKRQDDEKKMGKKIIAEVEQRETACIQELKAKADAFLQPPPKNWRKTTMSYFGTGRTF